MSPARTWLELRPGRHSRGVRLDGRSRASMRRSPWWESIGSTPPRRSAASSSSQPSQRPGAPMLWVRVARHTSTCATRPDADGRLVETMMAGLRQPARSARPLRPADAGLHRLSDAKLLDAQAGLETSMGATLAALAGINSVSGPAMLDCRAVQSSRSSVVDHEICADGPRADFEASSRRGPISRRAPSSGAAWRANSTCLIGQTHAARHLRAEITFQTGDRPPPIGPVGRGKGSRDSGERARRRGGAAWWNRYNAVARARRCQGRESPRRMTAEARQSGMDRPAGGRRHDVAL